VTTTVPPRLGALIVPEPSGGRPFELRRLASLAARAEDAGLARVAVEDHLIHHTPTFDPVACLGALAHATRAVRLATSMLLLPLRHPLQVAQSFSTLDHLSGGRIELGVGVGGEWPSDYEALGLDVHQRGQRANESLEVICRLWAGGPVSFSGRHFRLDAVELSARPLQRPRPPIVVGGRAEAALERAARFGDRWDGIFLDTAQFTRRRQRLAELADEHQRPGVGSGLVAWVSIQEPARARGELERTVSGFYGLAWERLERFCFAGSADEVAARLAEYVDLGATDLTLIPAGDPDAQLAGLADVADALGALTTLSTARATSSESTGHAEREPAAGAVWTDQEGPRR